MENIPTHTVLEDVFAFFGTSSPEGFILSLFGKVFTRTQVNPDVLIGQKFSDLVFWQSSEQTPDNLNTAFAEVSKGRAIKLQTEFRINKDERLQIELNFQPITDDNNQATEIFFYAYDLTDFKHDVAKYKARSDSILFVTESVDLGLWNWDLVENKIYSTPKCKEFFDVSVNEPLTFGKFLAALHQEDEKSVIDALDESQKTGKKYSFKFRVKYWDGVTQWFSAHGKTVFDDSGNPTKMIGIFQKLSDQNFSGMDFEKIYEREKKARDAAEEANRAKDFFLAVVSHELRSPLNAILGWSKILRSDKLDEETRNKALETIEKSARSQAKLLDDLIDSARVTSGKLKLEFRKVNLFEIARNAYNLKKPIAESKNILLELMTDKANVTVFADSSRLEQVISNLLSNAIKFTPDNGRIRMEIKTEGDKATLYVIDSGHGISKTDLPNIFRQFAQGTEKRMGEKGGLGLGLSISKILVEKHDGKIQAASEGIGKGATFSITLPMLAEEQVNREKIVKTKPVAENFINNINILIVEDDPDSREVLQFFLEQSGAKVRSANSAKQALSFLEELEQNSLPDVIVSDLAMPEDDGFSLIKQIRQMPPEKGGKIPAMALSAFASNDSKQKAFDVGFQKYHTKPFEPNEIIEDILQLLKEKI